MSGAVVIGCFESGPILRQAAVELQPTHCLVSDVDLVTDSATRGSGGVLADIRVVGGLRLGIEIEHREGKRDFAVVEFLPRANFLSGLRGDERGTRNASVSRLIDAADIVAVKASPGTDVVFARG